MNASEAIQKLIDRSNPQNQSAPEGYVILATRLTGEEKAVIDSWSTQLGCSKTYLVKLGLVLLGQEMSLPSMPSNFLDNSPRSSADRPVTKTNRPSHRIPNGRLMTAAEVAKCLGCHPTTVSRMRRQGTLESVKLGSTYRYNPEVIRKFMGIDQQ